MSRRAPSFTQADIARALRAAQQTGPQWCVEIVPGVGIRLFPGLLRSNRVDPLTMSGEDYSRLVKEAEAKWLASIPGTPLGKRERETLAQLAAHGAGVEVDWSKIKGCGPNTVDRLVARGFIETRYGDKFPDRIDRLVLNAAGRLAWVRLDPAIHARQTSDYRLSSFRRRRLLAVRQSCNLPSGSIGGRTWAPPK